MKHTPISRRDFLKNLGIAGAGTLLAASPWLSAFSEVTNTSNEKCRLAIIGPGSRGRFLMGFLAKNPKVEIVALCDIYKPSIESALELVPNAKVYGDYREVLEDKSIDAILVATPLSSHCKIVLDAFDAGKHVFCEKVSRWKSVTVCIRSIVARERFSSQDNSVCSILVTLKQWR